MNRKLTLVSIGVLFSFVCAACVSPPARENELPYWAQPKSRFQGEWWMQRTVTSTPFNLHSTYIGEGDLNDRIRWKVEERYLIAYRAVSFTLGKNPDVSGINDEETPVAMYPIRRHFDVLNGMIIDYPLRPWFERTWFDVDWGSDGARSLRFAPLNLPQAAAPYFVSRPTDPDFPIFSDDYLDFTTHLTIHASESADPEGHKKNFCQTYQASIDIRDCAPLDVTYRTSFRKVPEKRAYEPFRLADLKTFYERSWFYQFWRGGGTHWIDNQYGVTDQGLELVGNRFNLWENTRNTDGSLIPYRQRRARTIAFHVTPEFPQELWEEAQYAFDEWNRPLRQVVGDLRFWECVDAGGSKGSCEAERKAPAEVITLCHNPVIEGDDAACGKPGDSPRMGDIRYNFLSWINSPSVFRPIGLAWWSVDMPTGEIIAANVKVYGLGLDTAAASARDAVLFAQGRIAPYELIFQTYMDDWLKYLLDHSTQTSGQQALTSVFENQTSAQPSLWTPTPIQSPPSELKASSNAFGNWSTALAPFKGHPLENYVTEADAYLLKGLDPARPGSGAVEAASPLRSLFSENQRELTPAEQRMKELGADLSLPADLFLGDVIKEFATATPEEIYNELRSRFSKAVFIHEVGHVLGLRHNFGASYDALNFKPDYWKLRDDGAIGPRYVDPLSPKEIAGDINRYAYASVMDYHPSPNQFLHGLGHYDEAGIKMLYGNLVEFLPVRNDEAKGLFQSMYRKSNLVPVALRARPEPAHPDKYVLTGYHPSRYGEILGDLETRVTEPASHLKDSWNWGLPLNNGDGWAAVPYIGCAEEQENIPYCAKYDHGVDPYETTVAGISWFQTWYPLNNFRRSRITFKPQDYIDAVWVRTFRPIKVWQQFLYAYRVDIGERQAQALSDPDAFGPLVAAVNEGFNFASRTLAMPEPGPYLRDVRPDGTTQLTLTNAFSSSFTYASPAVDPSLVELSIQFPEGRFYTSTFGLGATRALNVELIGSAVDKQLALEALLDPEFFTFPGYETWANPRFFMVNYYQSHPSQLLDVLGAIIAGDSSRFAPRFDGTKVSFRDYTDLNSSVLGTPVEPATPLSMRIRTLMYGLSLMYSGYADRSFLEHARVFILGNGEAIDSSRPFVDFLDSTSGKTFRAYSFVTSGREMGIGARLVTRANALANAAAGLGGESEPVRQRARQMLRDQIDILEMTRTLTRELDWARFGGPRGG